MEIQIRKCKSFKFRSAPELRNFNSGAERNFNSGAGRNFKSGADRNFNRDQPHISETCASEAVARVQGFSWLVIRVFSSFGLGFFPHSSAVAHIEQLFTTQPQYNQKFDSDLCCGFLIHPQYHRLLRDWPRCAGLLPFLFLQCEK